LPCAGVSEEIRRARAQTPRMLRMHRRIFADRMISLLSEVAFSLATVGLKAISGQE
jgi:hypothetical protein